MAAAHGGTRLGGRPFNHEPSSETEQEYDRLRDAARHEQGQRQHFAAESQKAYARGDGAEAHRLSELGKQHAAKADDYNAQAASWIFRHNNAAGRVAQDTVDCHGLYVDEAVEIVSQRMQAARQQGASHLHVIVGKGNHSPGHIQKIKPAIEELCRNQGLQYHTEENQGRIYIDLDGTGPPQHFDPYQQQPNHPNYGQPMYESAFPFGGRPNYGSYAGAAGGYPGQQNMQYGKPQQQMGYQDQQQQQQKKDDLCCGLCTVM